MLCLEQLAVERERNAAVGMGRNRVSGRQHRHGAQAAGVPALDAPHGHQPVVMAHARERRTDGRLDMLGIRQRKRTHAGHDE